MKIIELIDADYGLLSILLRLDIQLPFGDISIGEMCRRYDMSSALFLMICRMYACPDYEPDSASLTAADLPHLVRYLRSSHRYWLDTVIPRIGRGVDDVLQSCDRMQAEVLRKFYNDYCDEIRRHLQYEETEMFPYVERLARGEVGESCTTRQRCDLLFDIFSLRDDLAKHTLVESKILDPVVMVEERRRGL